MDCLTVFQIGFFLNLNEYGQMQLSLYYCSGPLGTWISKAQNGIDAVFYIFAEAFISYYRVHV